MKLAWDTETALIRPGLMAPPMACLTWANEQLGTGIFHVRQAYDVCKRELESDTELLGLNMAYDSGVIGNQFRDLLPAIFEAYIAGRIRDVGLDQRLIDIANGELEGRHEPNPDFDASKPAGRGNKPTKWRKNLYSLAELSKRLLGETVAKGEDTWRMRYGSLINVPMASWPSDAKHYAEKDAHLTMRAHLAQNVLDAAGTFRVDSEAQAAANFGLHLMSCRGLRTDGAACLALIEAAEVEIERCRALCEEVGLLVRDKKGELHKKTSTARDWMLGAVLRSNGYTDDASARNELLKVVCAFDNEDRDGYHVLPFGDDSISVSITKTGEICLDAEACKDTNDPILKAYATYTSATTLRSKTKRMLFGATGPLQGRFQTVVATGRTSMSAPKGNAQVGDNYQNMRRNAMENEDGEVLPGQRECFIPRDGFTFGSIDFDNAEMRAMGQCCIWKVGYSKLADALNAGQDAHLALAASRLLNLPIPYDEAERRLKDKDPEMDNARQFAKVPNFALLGGARALTMIPYAKGMKITLSEERAHELYAGFHAEWQEVAPYHDMIRRELKLGGGSMLFEQFVSKRLRYVDRYTVGCNTGFQGLTADAAKSCLILLARECYTDEKSPLYGSYPVLFAHDEVIFEFRRDRAHEAAFRARDVMVAAYNRYTPDVKMSATPCLMDRWYKGAKDYYSPEGKLIPWQPKARKAA